MTDNPSRIVVSNQTGLHERLEETVRKHLSHPTKKPISDHSKAAFEKFLQWFSRDTGPLILDACCGVGDSTRKLAHQFTDHRVLGVDKSLKRLSTERADAEPENMLLLRADLNDFYRMLVAEKIEVDRHYILYPNPWPKSAHLGRRWHGAPAFADIVRISCALELRSNWKLYLEEFQSALIVAGYTSQLMEISPAEPITPFEAKYRQSGHALWQLTATIS